MEKEDDLSRRVFAREVFDVIILQIKDRFSYRGRVQAFQLFNSQSVLKIIKKFPVCSAYPFLNHTRLKTE